MIFRLAYLSLSKYCVTNQEVPPLAGTEWAARPHWAFSYHPPPPPMRPCGVAAIVAVVCLRTRVEKNRNQVFSIQVKL